MKARQSAVAVLVVAVGLFGLTITYFGYSAVGVVPMENTGATTMGATTIAAASRTTSAALPSVATTGYKTEFDATVDFATDPYHSIFNRKEPQGFSEWLVYATSNRCSTKPVDYARIYVDLSHWAESPSKGIPESSMNVDLPTRYAVRSEFVSGSGFSNKNWPGSDAVEPLNASFATAGVPSFKFFVNKMDEPLSLPDNDTSPYKDTNDIFRRNQCIEAHYGNSSVVAPAMPVRELHGYLLNPDSFVTQPHSIPIFSQSKLQCFRDLIIPLKDHMGITKKGHVKDAFPWEKKKNVLFWRGSSSDGRNAPHTRWRDFHRTRLVKWANDWAKLHPDRVFDAGVKIPENVTDLHVDIGFGKIIQCNEPTCTDIKNEYGVKSLVSFEETQQFKYLIVVDGNGWPNRMQRYLETNSVILYNGIFWDWYLWRLEPMVHYVPVALDYSDLEEKVEWLMKNDNAAKQISENARKLMNSLNEITQLTCYSGLMMLEYAALYNPNI
ncbi:hypothetical protein HDU84_002612 [Entophlyctis sp. JEL0112]|nr:hypothetical protein HDU84_002612 [Entophlyctis sp. JEL0112]